MATPRQHHWTEASDKAARQGDDLSAGLFALIAQPNDREREHSCRGHSVGFRTTEGRRGVRCGICKTVTKWVD